MNGRTIADSYCKLHNQQQQVLPKINVKICRFSQIVPNLPGRKLSRLNLNDAIAASRIWQLRVERRIMLDFAL